MQGIQPFLNLFGLGMEHFTKITLLFAKPAHFSSPVFSSLGRSFYADGLFLSRKINQILLIKSVGYRKVLIKK